MFGIGFSEILIIGLVAVIFINPKDLPGVFRNIGRIYAGLSRSLSEMMRYVDDAARSIDDESAGRLPGAVIKKTVPPKPRRRLGTGKKRPGRKK